MNRPWEVMLNFQKKLRPANSDENSHKTSAQFSAAAQRLLPSNNLYPTKAHRVQNIINESSRIVEQSRYPASLNNTTASFCRNCSCDNCANQTMLNDITLNQPHVNNLVQNFEKFLEGQRQQFMAMIQQLAGLDTSAANSITLPQPACNLPTSNTSSNQPPITQCDSSGTAKYDLKYKRCLGPVSTSTCSTSTSLIDEMDDLSDSTVVEQKDEPIRVIKACNRVKPLPDTSNNEKDTEIIKHDKINSSENPEDQTHDKINSSENSEDQKHQQNDCLSAVFEVNSFDDFIDDSFRPVRKSSFMKMKDSFVVLEKLSPHKAKESIYDQIKSNKTKVKSTFPKESKMAQDPKNEKMAVVSTFDMPCTRSGRTVKKPQEYWAASSRVDIKRELPYESQSRAPKRRAGGNVRGKVKSKENDVKNSKENNSKSSVKDINQHEHNSELAPTSSEGQNHPVVTSSTDTMLAPSNTGTKRGRTKKVTTDSSHTSKNGRAKRIKMENQTVGTSSIDSCHKSVPSVAVKQQNNNRLKRNNRKDIHQDENSSAGVVPINSERANQRERVKRDMLNLIKDKSRIPNGKEKHNTILQLQKQNLLRFPSLSGDSCSTEPEYECYFEGQLSD